MGQPAIDPVGAPTCSRPLLNELMLASSIQIFQNHFRDLFSIRFGGTALNRGSTFATAIRLMIAAAARICGAASIAAAIGLRCTRLRKQADFSVSCSS